MDDTIRRLKELTDASDNIVFFGGAGVSTESGIPDFRSVDGLYHQKFKYPPETMLSHTFTRRTPRNSTTSTGPKCWPWTPSPTPPTASWRNGSGRGS